MSSEIIEREVMRDGQGRIVAADMTDREIAEESLILLRAFADALSVIGNNPMLGAMMPNLPKF